MSELHWNADNYIRHAGFVAAFGGELLGLIDLPAGARLLDLGCGDGALTIKLRERGFDVLGVDSSADQIEAARARGLAAEVVDGQALTYAAEFDGVISNAALHWMRQPEAVLAGVWRSLRPGGCFIGEMGGAGNIRRVVAAAEAALRGRDIDPVPHNPWFFPSVDTYQAMLEAQGFALDFIMLFTRPTPLEGDVGHWLRLFAQSFAAAVPADGRDAFYADVAARLAPQLRDAQGNWTLDYVRLRFKARRPS